MESKKDVLAGNQLIEELLEHTEKFSSEGKWLELLQRYFEGFPLESLRFLLTNMDVVIRRQASFILSELGKQASSCIDIAVLLLKDEDVTIRYNALESIMVCAYDEYIDRFVFVVRSLDSNDQIIRVLAMYLISNASEPQIRTVIRSFDPNNPLEIDHVEGLTTLLQAESVLSNKAVEMIKSDNRLLEKYGAIFARRAGVADQQLIREVRLSSDLDLQEFCKAL